MIAVVDIGNTLTKCAVFGRDGALLADESFSTGKPIGREEEAFFEHSLERAVIGSVVPGLVGSWEDFLHALAGQVHLASAASPWGFSIKVEEPSKVGVDRLANMEAALAFPGSVLVVDAGTATKFDLLEGMAERAFPGGAIAPGMEISYEALLSRTAQLPRIELRKHSPVIGYNTETAIRSGVVHGFASAVDGMILRILEERQLPATVSVVATGGNACFLQGRARFLTHFKPHLTLEGLHAIGRKI